MVLYRRQTVKLMKSEAALKFLDFLESIKDKRCFIAVLGSPDPDGMASAWAIAYIAKSVGVELPIFAFEVISRPDNWEFVDRLKVPMKFIRNPEIIHGFDGYIAVDRQNPMLPKDVVNPPPVLAHIDHHQPSPTGAIFKDIRQNVGSASTILSFYLETLKDKIPRDNDVFKRLATALLIGIRTDTDAMLKANSLDYKAASYISPWVIAEHLYAIMEKPVGEAFLKTLRNVLNTLEKYPYIAVGFAGRIPKEHRDTIGQSADFILHSEGVNTVVIFGIMGDDIVGSMRTTDENLHPYSYLLSAFQKYLKRPINAGGRRFAGGFQFEISSLMDDPAASDEEIARRVMELLIQRGKRRYFAQGKHLK